MLKDIKKLWRTLTRLMFFNQIMHSLCAVVEMLKNVEGLSRSLGGP